MKKQVNLLLIKYFMTNGELKNKCLEITKIKSHRAYVEEINKLDTSDILGFVNSTSNNEAEFIPILISKIKATLNITDEARIKSDFESAKSYAKAYSNRILYELMQNAEDAGASEFIVSINENENKISFKNNGKAFSINGFISLMFPCISPKERESEICIGKKGLGFRALLNISDKIEIRSGTLIVAYDKDLESDNFKFRRPMLQFPIIKQHDKYFEGVEIVIKYEIKEIFDKEINAFSAQNLLFLKNIKSVKFEGINGELKSFSIDRKEINKNKQEVDVIENENKSTWDVYYYDAKEEESSNSYNKGLAASNSAIIAIPRDPTALNKKLFSFFPTDIEVNIPALIHGNLSLSPNRDNLSNDENDKSHNKEIFKRICEVVKKYIEDENVAYNAEESLERLWQKFDVLYGILRFRYYKEFGIELLKNLEISAKIYPCINGCFVDKSSYANIKYYSDYFANFLQDLYDRISEEKKNCKIFKHIRFRENREFDTISQEQKRNIFPSEINEVAELLSDEDVIAILMNIEDLSYSFPEKFHILKNSKKEVIRKKAYIMQGAENDSFQEPNVVNPNLYEKISSEDNCEKLMKQYCDVEFADARIAKLDGLLNQLRLENNSSQSIENNLKQVFNLFKKTHNIQGAENVDFKNIYVVAEDGSVVLAKDTIWDKETLRCVLGEEDFEKSMSKSNIISFEKSGLSALNTNNEMDCEFLEQIGVSRCIAVESVENEYQRQSRELPAFFQDYMFKSNALNGINTINPAKHRKISNISLNILNCLKNYQRNCTKYAYIAFKDKSFKDALLASNNSGNNTDRYQTHKYNEIYKLKTSYVFYECFNWAKEDKSLFVGKDLEDFSDEQIDFSFLAKLPKSDVERTKLGIIEILKEMGARDSVIDLSIDEMRHLLEGLKDKKGIDQSAIKRLYTDITSGKNVWKELNKEHNFPLFKGIYVLLSTGAFEKDNVQYYADRDIPKSFVENQRIRTIAIDPRQNSTNIYNLWGIPKIERKSLKIEKTGEENYSLHQDFSKRYDENIRYILTAFLYHRKSEKEKNKSIWKKALESLSSKIKFYKSEVTFSFNGENGSLNEYEFCSDGKIYYICATSDTVDVDIENVIINILASEMRIKELDRDLSDSIKRILKDGGDYYFKNFKRDSEIAANDSLKEADELLGTTLKTIIDQNGLKVETPPREIKNVEDLRKVQNFLKTLSEKNKEIKSLNSFNELYRHCTLEIKVEELFKIRIRTENAKKALWKSLLNEDENLQCKFLAQCRKIEEEERCKNITNKDRFLKLDFMEWEAFITNNSLENLKDEDINYERHYFKNIENLKLLEIEENDLNDEEKSKFYFKEFSEEELQRIKKLKEDEKIEEARNLVEEQKAFSLENILETINHFECIQTKSLSQNNSQGSNYNQHGRTGGTGNPNVGQRTALEAEFAEINALIYFIEKKKIRKFSDKYSRALKKQISNKYEDYKKYFSEKKVEHSFFNSGNDALGFDFSYYDKEDEEFFVEVKSIKKGRFFLTDREIKKAKEAGKNYILFLLFWDDNVIQTLEDPLKKLKSNTSKKRLEYSNIQPPQKD